MLTPSPAELLAGVADGLQATVLPELGAGPARRQVQAAIGIVRRLATALSELGPVLAADAADVADTLGRMGHPVPESGADAGDGAVASLDDLLALDRRLHEVLAEVAATVGAGGGPPGKAAKGEADGEAEAELRALLGRMLDREARLGLSPWEG